jgi:hypothetical protein
MKRLLEQLPDKSQGAVRGGYHTGARKNELRRIEWGRVDLNAGLIRLPGAVTKNKKPRTLPIYGDMRRWLERQRETCPEDCVWVFHGAKKHPVDEPSKRLAGGLRARWTFRPALPRPAPERSPEYEEGRSPGPRGNAHQRPPHETFSTGTTSSTRTIWPTPANAWRSMPRSGSWNARRNSAW